MVKKKVLVIESNPAVARLEQRILSAMHEVVLAAKNTSVIEAIQHHQPDLVILDHVEACEPIRQQRRDILIVVLLDGVNERQIVRAFDLGADDCVTKPFGSEEFAARIRSLLRRRTELQSSEPEPELLRSEDGYLVLDTDRRQVHAGEQLVRLRPKEFEVLQYLMLHAGKVLTHRTVLRAVWGPEYGDEDGYVRIYIRQVRCKIEPDPSHPVYLVTEPGVGYVFCSPRKDTTES